jgi:hypothetical protein
MKILVYQFGFAIALPNSRTEKFYVQTEEERKVKLLRFPSSFFIFDVELDGMYHISK